MTIIIKDKQTGLTLPLVSMETSVDGHQILSVTCGFGGAAGQKTIKCLGPDGNVLSNAELPFTVEIRDRDALGLIGG